MTEPIHGFGTSEATTQFAYKLARSASIESLQTAPSADACREIGTNRISDYDDVIDKPLALPLELLPYGLQWPTKGTLPMGSKPPPGNRELR